MCTSSSEINDAIHFMPYICDLAARMLGTIWHVIFLEYARELECWNDMNKPLKYNVSLNSK
jgi:hypothetical protein